MGIVEGPFTQVRFLGASITGVDASVGWNEQSSTVTVRLVEDTQHGDRFRPGIVGSPVSLRIEAFRFDGILQYWKNSGSFAGNPVYEVQITDPREILAGVQIIIGSFRQPVSAMPNLINAFGHYESILGFGGGLVNEAGMFWQAPFSFINVDPAKAKGITISQVGTVGIKPAIELLTQTGNAFGGPINFRGYNYQVDFSGLPTPPSYYRLGGVSRDILGMVAELCQDAGFDFIVYLEGMIIKFKAVSRLVQPQPGQIGNFVNSQPNVSAKSYGVELRNDVTNAVLLGGDVRQLELITNPNGDETIWPFWGFNANNLPIMGTGQPEIDHQVLLNSGEIGDIMGAGEYHVNMRELRCAMSDFDSWAGYVLRWEPAKADTIGLVGAVDSTNDLQALFPDVMFQHDMIAQREEDALRFGQMNESDYWTTRANRVYDFVSKYANEYFGRKFLVKLPFFLYWTVEPETTHVISSMEISQDGGFTSDGSMPLGLNYLDENLFITDDGRFECFVRFKLDPTIDLEKLSYDNAVISNGALYMKASIEDQIVYPEGSIFPYCIVTLDDAVFAKSPDPLGGLAEIAEIVQVPPATILYSAAIRHGSFPVKIGPTMFRPEAAAIPMKSNQDSYGPWGTFPPYAGVGAPGKVYFEREESLVPWAYGDYDTMNSAAAAQLSNLSSHMQESEIGSLNIVGSPDFSLGDELVAGGPNITGISLSVDATGGVTTSCELRTFTPTFGAFAKYNADRLKRLGVATTQLRRQFRALYQRSLSQQRTAGAIARGFMENTSRAVRQMTPHSVLYGTITWSDTYNYRTNASIATPIEAFANSRPDSDDMWKVTGLMSLTGLIRPFSTDKTLAFATGGASDLSHFEDAGITNQALTNTDLNPFTSESDIDLLASGDSYPGSFHRLKPPVDKNGDPLLDELGNPKHIDYDKARLLGLRGPLIIVGWGFELTGQPFPNSVDNFLTGDTYDLTTSFADKHRQHPEMWKAGPVDLRWDKWRKVYASPGCILSGKLLESLTGGPAKMRIEGTQLLNEGGLYDHIKVWNDLGGPTIPANKKVYAAYNPITNLWMVVAAEC